MADRWGGGEVQPVAAFENADHDWVLRYNVAGKPVVLFAYAPPHSPQLITYQTEEAAAVAFNEYRLGMSTARNGQPRTAGDLVVGDLVTQNIPGRGPREYPVQRVALGPVGVVEVWFSETFHWTVPVGEPVTARRPAPQGAEPPA